MYKTLQSFVLLLILCITFMSCNLMATVTINTSTGTGSNTAIDTMADTPNDTTSDASTDSTSAAPSDTTSETSTDASNNQNDEPSWMKIYYEQVKDMIKQVAGQLNNVD